MKIDIHVCITKPQKDMAETNTNDYLRGGGTRWAGKGVGKERPLSVCLHTHTRTHAQARTQN